MSCIKLVLLFGTRLIFLVKSSTEPSELIGKNNSNISAVSLKLLGNNYSSTSIPSLRLKEKISNTSKNASTAQIEENDSSIKTPPPSARKLIEENSRIGTMSPLLAAWSSTHSFQLGKNLYNAVVENDINSVKELLKEGASPNWNGNIYGLNPLIAASQHNSLEIAKRLLGEGADINLTDGHGWSALMYTAFKSSTEVARILIDRGANVNIQTKKGSTPLMIAAQYNSIAVADMLINSNANLDAQSDKGLTPLIFCAFNGSDAIAKKLVAAGAQLELRELHGHNALTIAAWKGQTAVAQILLDAGAEPDATDKHEWTALMYTAKSNATDITDLLLAAGADVNLQSHKGFTALMVSAMFGRRVVVRKLLTAGARTDLLADGEISAIDFALEYGFNEIALIIEESQSSKNITQVTSNTTSTSNKLPELPNELPTSELPNEVPTSEQWTSAEIMRSKSMYTGIASLTIIGLSAFIIFLIRIDATKRWKNLLRKCEVNTMINSEYVELHM